MSEPSTDIPENIGRNDPCTCGSGRKYKKCCQRKHRLQKESEKKANEPHRLVGSKTIPWKVYKVLKQIHQNNALGLFFDLTHDSGPLRERFADKAAFIEAIDQGEEVLPASPDFELLHFRLDPPDTYMLLREDDPKNQEVSFQLLTLRRNEVDADGESREVEHEGYRIWDYKNARLQRDSFDDEVPPLDTFGVAWHPAT